MWWLILIVLLVGVGGFLFYASYAIGSNVYIRTLCCKETTEKIIALTFDDGPDETGTAEVLDVLKKHQVVATFFCIGEKASRTPDLVRRIEVEGHLIGNHSYTHSSTFPLLRLKKMKADLKQTDQILQQITGTPPRFFRPPFGVTNPTIAKAVKELGYVTIGWSIRSLDTCTPSIEKVLKRINRYLSPGEVILLHDRLPVCATIVECLIVSLKKENYKFVRIDDLFDIHK